MSEIRSVHGELIKRCKVIKLTSEEINRLRFLGKYPKIGDLDYAVLCTNISHKNLPSYFCYINGYELVDFIKTVYLRMNYNAGIKTIIEIYKFWNWSNRTWLLEHPEIETYQTHIMLDDFIEGFTALNNKLLRKYLSDDEIMSLVYDQCSIKFEDDKATILK